MNTVLPVYNKKKRIIGAVLIIVLLISVAICYFLKPDKNIELSELEKQDKEYEERLAKRDENANFETINSSIDFSAEQFKNIQIAEDNTVSITDFGAIGDSNYYNPETNKYYADENFENEEHLNSQAIQSCFDYAEENNCNVKVPKGNYCIENYIIIPDNIEMIGEDGATFLVYDNFNNPIDDFVFRNRYRDNQGIIKIKNIDFEMKAYKDFKAKERGRYFLKFYDLKELSISDCEIDIENEGEYCSFTCIDIRGNFEKIDILNNTIINQNKYIESGNLWIRNANDDAIAIWGRPKIGNINIKNNEIEYTNVSNQKNDILIALYGTKDTWNVEAFNFESNIINILGNERGIMNVVKTPENVNILKNTINNASTSEDSYGGVFQISNDDVNKIDDTHVNIAENKIKTIDAVACRQIVGLKNSKANIYNNNINAKVTYGLIFSDNNCEEAEIELNNNNIDINLANNSTFLSARDNNIKFIANNNIINNVTGEGRNYIYIAPENSKYEYQKNTKQNITLTNNKFTNFHRILQYSNKNEVENFNVEKNEFQGMKEITYESGLKNIFTGNILIKDNIFDTTKEESLMNIKKTDLSQVKNIQIEDNYLINKNIEEVANNVLEKYNQFKVDYTQEIQDNNILSQLEEIQQYITTVKETQNIEEAEMLDKINKHYNLSKVIIENCKKKQQYDNISKIAEMLQKLEEIAEEYSDLLIVMPNSEQEHNDIDNKKLEEIETLINESSDLGMEFVSEKLQKCKDYNDELKNIKTFNDSNSKRGLILEKTLYINEISKQVKDLANLYIDKYILENPITITYSIPKEQLTNQDVKVTVNKGDDTKITNNGGSNEWNFTTNGYYIFNYKRRGREGEIRAEVNNIDKEKPKIINVELDKIYTDAIKPLATDTNLEKVQLYNDDELIETYKNGDEISEEGLYRLIATDKVGNTEQIQFQFFEKSSTEYIIQDKYIKNINAGTTVKQFREKFPIRGEYVIRRNGRQVTENNTIATGDELEFNDSKQKYTLIVTGDINKDSEITVKDLTMLQSYILEKTELDDVQKLASDTNIDNKEIGVKDLVRMRIMLLNE